MDTLSAFIICFIIYIWYNYYYSSQHIKDKELGNKKLKVPKSPSLPETGPINEKSIKVAKAASETVIKPTVKPVVKPTVKPSSKPTTGSKIKDFGSGLGSAILGQAMAKNAAKSYF